MSAMFIGLIFACNSKSDDTSSRDTDTSDVLDTDDTVDTSESETAIDTGDDVVGGACEYNDYVGKCAVEEDLSVTFTGTIEGVDVSLPDNTATGLTVGDSLECTISYITVGTCTPCILSLGECGSEAFAYIDNLNQCH